MNANVIVLFTYYYTAAELDKSTKMFAKLADPDGANNALSQVLYGLALRLVSSFLYSQIMLTGHTIRHGWGCAQDPAKAVIYLSSAASNSASIEAEALRTGMKKGGAAKGELVLAMFELGNCFRHGWGIDKNPAAAKQYYETAANLGDTDAMNEAAWCYLEGFGGKKDKVSLLQRLLLPPRRLEYSTSSIWTPMRFEAHANRRFFY